MFSREVLADAGLYFTTATDLADAVVATEVDVTATRQRAGLAARRPALYDWDDVTSRYEALLERLIGRNVAAQSTTGRGHARR